MFKHMKKIIGLLLIGVFTAFTFGVKADPVKKDASHFSTVVAMATTNTDVIAISIVPEVANQSMSFVESATKPKPSGEKHTTVVRQRKAPSTVSGKYTYNRNVKQINGRIKKYGSHR